MHFENKDFLIIGSITLVMLIACGLYYKTSQKNK